MSFNLPTQEKYIVLSFLPALCLLRVMNPVSKRHQQQLKSFELEIILPETPQHRSFAADVTQNTNMSLSVGSSHLQPVASSFITLYYVD